MAGKITVADSVSGAQDSGSTARVFLTAQWRDLAMLNFEVSSALLAPRIPPGTELDLFDDRAFITLVGFRFLDTRVYGIPVPFHRNFAEVNLRFYVRRRERGGVKRGVVFIQEIVPRRAVAAIARWAYHENYRRLPMSHHIARDATGLRAEYAWRFARRWNRLKIRAAGEPRHVTQGSLEQFIAEHYWGYCAQPDGGTIEYQVAHEPWRIWNVAESEFAGDAAALFGREFTAVLSQAPDSAFLSEGSRVIVYAGKKL